MRAVITKISGKTVPEASVFTCPNSVYCIKWSRGFPTLLCKGSYGAFWRQTKTQDKSHLGVRDLCTGHCNSKEIINSDKTELDPILLPVLNLRVLEIIDL